MPLPELDMDDASPIANLLDRLRAGDPQAADHLFQRYALRLTRLAEQHLSRKLAGRLDGEDIVQSVFRTFFRRTSQGEFHIDESAQLWRLLVKITVLKANAKGRYHMAQRRTAGAESGGDAWLAEAVAREPGPDEAAALVDQIEQLLHGLPPLYCQALELRLQGHTVAEIAPRLGVSRQTVYRVLGLLQQRLTDNVPVPNPEKSAELM
jgi:RNA polymerase sigma-70 factor (ECF subfamily)